MPLHSFLLKNRRGRDGDDESSTPITDILQLIHDFALKVPGQNHHIVRFSFANAVGMMNGDVRPGEKSPLFIRASINRVLNQVLSDTAIMQQRGALAWSAVTGNTLAITRGLKEEFQQRQLGLLHLPGEALVAFNGTKARPFFIF